MRKTLAIPRFSHYVVAIPRVLGSRLFLVNVHVYTLAGHSYRCSSLSTGDGFFREVTSESQFLAMFQTGGLCGST